MTGATMDGASAGGTSAGATSAAGMGTEAGPFDPGAVRPALPRERGAFAQLLLGPTGKVAALGFLVLILMIPTFMVEGLVRERERRAERVVAEIGSQWGAAQTLVGPLLVVPAKRRVVVEAPNTADRTNGEAAIRTTTRGDFVVIRPVDLDTTMTARTDVRSRSIYDARVYTAEAGLSARFEPVDPIETHSDIVSVDWSGAFVAVGLSDLSAIESATITHEGRELDGVEPGMGVLATDGETGFHSKPLGLAGPPDGPFEVAVALRARGSQRMAIAPAGLDTRATIAADWPHPSFGLSAPGDAPYLRRQRNEVPATGGRLPSEREITEEGFTATWSVPRLSLALGPTWIAGDSGVARPLRNQLLGVRLVEPVDHYDRVGRTVRYGTLVLIGVFSVAFLIELFAPGALSVVQYLMVGSMIVVFYVLLLALSEHVSFSAAYVIGAGASGGVLSAFVGTVVGGRRWGLIAAGAFAALYGALYAVLGLEDLALLAGSVFTFVLLTTIMFATRRIDWSGGASAQPRTVQQTGG